MPQHQKASGLFLVFNSFFYLLESTLCLCYLPWKMSAEGRHKFQVTRKFIKFEGIYTFCKIKLTRVWIVSALLEAITLFHSTSHIITTNLPNSLGGLLKSTYINTAINHKMGNRVQDEFIFLRY